MGDLAVNRVCVQGAQLRLRQNCSYSEDLVSPSRPTLLSDIERESMNDTFGEVRIPLAAESRLEGSGTYERVILEIFRIHNPKRWPLASIIEMQECWIPIADLHWVELRILDILATAHRRQRFRKDVWSCLEDHGEILTSMADWVIDRWCNLRPGDNRLQVRSLFIGTSEVDWPRIVDYISRGCRGLIITQISRLLVISTTICWKAQETFRTPRAQPVVGTCPSRISRLENDMVALTDTDEDGLGHVGLDWNKVSLHDDEVMLIN